MATKLLQTFRILQVGGKSKIASSFALAIQASSFKIGRLVLQVGQWQFTKSSFRGLIGRVMSFTFDRKSQASVCSKKSSLHFLIGRVMPYLSDSTSQDVAF